MEHLSTWLVPTRQSELDSEMGLSCRQPLRKLGQEQGYRRFIFSEPIRINEAARRVCQHGVEKTTCIKSLRQLELNIYVHLHIHKHVHIYTLTYIYVRAHVDTCIYMCIYIYVHMYMCIYIYTYLFLRACMYTYAHTRIWPYIYVLRLTPRGSVIGSRSSIRSRSSSNSSSSSSSSSMQ